MNDEIDWGAAKRLMAMDHTGLHKLSLEELRAAANLLRTVGDECRSRSRVLHQLADSRAAVGEVDDPAPLPRRV